MRRASFFAGVSALAIAGTITSRARAAGASGAFAALEQSTGGRLGVFAIDTNSGRTLGYRQHERFLMCSTFKLPLSAMVLKKVDLGTESLDRRISYGTADLLEYAPAARRNVARGYMTVRELLIATVELSDNTAANLLLASVGGPPGFNTGMRHAGDSETILAHGEPQVNEPLRPRQTRDTTTPSAMAYDARDMVVGTYLQLQTRGVLQGWMIASKTGANLLRAGFPQTWTVGDKTGLGGAHNAFDSSDTRNDVAIAWAPSGAPIVVAAYLTGVTVRARARDAALASVARIVVATLRPSTAGG
ncbi:MAG TPA: class A beta-lactamase [Candidatus Tumulicola sp.]|jgi:beta-lactamase class A